MFQLRMEPLESIFMMSMYWLWLIYILATHDFIDTLMCLLTFTMSMKLSPKLWQTLVTMGTIGMQTKHH
jgi:hypothetical protein